MPLLKKYVTDRGTSFKQHFCADAVCCPSRASLWTGRFPHNTNVTDVVPPYGGYTKFVSQGWNSNWFPLWMQAAGYDTYYTGKLFNDHSVANWNKPFPSGWTGSDFLLDPNTYRYHNATMQRNKEPPVTYTGQYAPDILNQKTWDFLDQAIQKKNPFFLAAAPIAPHSELDASQIRPGDNPLDKLIVTPPVPADRHKHLFPNAKVPRTPNFNPAKASGVSWMKSLARLNDTVLAYNDDWHRKRLQSLQTVDELVAGLIKRLSAAGILDNTYFFYTTDNGFHISQHRLPPGKQCTIEEDINIPLIVRGPGVKVGRVETGVVTAHTDLVPTWLEIATGRVNKGVGWQGLDGTPIPLTSKKQMPQKLEHINVEAWGMVLSEGEYRFTMQDGRYVPALSNNTYKALRLVGKGYSLLYTVFCTNEHELYDMTTDPYQLRNLYPKDGALSSPSQSVLNRPISMLLPRLDALLMITKSCKGDTCRNPWAAIHPQGNVKTLADAMNRKYDAFYQSIRPERKIQFSKCDLGYIISSEGPQELGVVYDDRKNYYS